MPIRTKAGAREWRARMDAAIKTVPDASASEAVDIYPKMHYTGALIPYKTRINWRGKLMQAKQDLWDAENNNPDNLPGAWSLIRYKDGYRYIPETMHADEEFVLDEIGYWELDDSFYKSKLAHNTWNPNAYPAGWELIGG